jgi:hypothetical protein
VILFVCLCKKTVEEMSVNSEPYREDGNLLFRAVAMFRESSDIYLIVVYLTTMSVALCVASYVTVINE